MASEFAIFGKINALKMIYYKSLIVLFLLWAVSQIGFAQPFQIGHTTINFVDSTRNNRTIATEIYYPSDVSGDNVALTAVNGTFPVLSFGHGFVMTWDAYQNYWSALVPQGYIMLFPKTEGSISPSHLDFGKDLAFIIDQMNALNTNSSSLFYNRVSPMNAVMGHSMGGGAAFLAVPLNNNIKAIVGFAAAETNPSAITAAASNSVPTLIFSGANDCVTPPVNHQIPIYNSLISTCKTLISITGGSHCQMANSNFFCNVGEGSCSPQPTISRAVQHATIISYLLPWLDYQLKGNCNQGAVFDAQLIADTAVTYQKNCLQCNALDVNSPLIVEVKVYPNPAGGFITVKVDDRSTNEIFIYDTHGRLLLSKTFTETTDVDVSGFQAGMYGYQIIQLGKVRASGKFIK